MTGTPVGVCGDQNRYADCPLLPCSELRPGVELGASSPIGGRVGSELAGLIERPEFQEVITALKNAGLLQGGEVSTAQRYEN
jgi:hypothetical protein